MLPEDPIEKEQEVPPSWQLMTSMQRSIVAMAIHSISAIISRKIID